MRRKSFTFGVLLKGVDADNFHPTQHTRADEKYEVANNKSAVFANAKIKIIMEDYDGMMVGSDGCEREHHQVVHSWM
jgi:hypothetical protein